MAARVTGGRDVSDQEIGPSRESSKTPGYEVVSQRSSGVAAGPREDDAKTRKQSGEEEGEEEK